MDEYVGGKIFGEIECDERVTKDLNHCLYCKVSQSGERDGKNWYKDISYKIPLNCVSGNLIKQCPACLKLYILADLTELK